MILFSSNHHHSHILSQSILYHYIYSININSQFQTLFFRQTINSYIKFTSISLFYFTLFLFQIISISFICYHIHFYHQYSFQSSINYPFHSPLHFVEAHLSVKSSLCYHRNYPLIDILF